MGRERDQIVREVLELAAQHRPDRCRCLLHRRPVVECSEHKMARLARSALPPESNPEEQ